jgi:hypothetical protein
MDEFYKSGEIVTFVTFFLRKLWHNNRQIRKSFPKNGRCFTRRTEALENSRGSARLPSGAEIETNFL